MAHGNHYDKESVQAPGGKWNGLWIVLGALGAGLIYGGFQVASDNDHSFHSYLTSFMFYLSIALGGLFFVMLQHLTRAGWSVTIRRMAEAFMKNIEEDPELANVCAWVEEVAIEAFQAGIKFMIPALQEAQAAHLPAEEV